MQKIPIRQIKEPTLTASFNIRKIETLLMENDMVQKLHRHDYFFVLVIDEGDGNHIIDFVPYPITNNSIFFMRPGQVHELFLKRGSMGYIVEFNNEFLLAYEQHFKSILRSISSQNYYSLTPNKNKKIISTLSLLFNEYVERQKSYADAMQAYFKIFLIHLSRQNGILSTFSKTQNKYSQEKLEELTELVEKNIFTKKNVSQYAQMLNLTTYQLNSITKETIDKTASELIKEQIILEAKRLLLASSNQINQIAFQLGYDDVSYFIRFFKKNTGYTPEAFRENFK